MRPMEFRGQTVKTKTWTYGYYVKCRGDHYILPEYNNMGFDERWLEWVKVIPETVGQFTGLADKNGQEIWEGDIIKTQFADVGLRLVIFRDDGFCDGNDWNKNGVDIGIIPDNSYFRKCEVIGNIHENPELLGE